MGLYLGLEITSGGMSTQRLGGLEIIRTEPLKNRENPEDEVHTYKASFWKSGTKTKGPVTFTHRYGDGAWVAVRRALEVLGS
ncbi:hypothetical protein SEA_MAGRITTE_210 [Microbacterium phage Magritte]|nr:hypothetical protein SEA_MAGRITTE_210 [Microbacterium phage Magritte]